MNNNKDFSEQLGDLFEEISLDQAGNLIDNTIEPSKQEIQEEVVNKLINNEVTVDKKILNELKNNLVGEKYEKAVLDLLRQNAGLTCSEEALEELQVVDEVIEEVEATEELEVVEPEPSLEVKKESYIDDLSNKLSRVLNQSGMRSSATSKGKVSESILSETLEARVDAIQTQLGLLRTSVLESAGNTIVSGIGQGGDGQSPGSGEVKLNRLDDVHLPLRTTTTTSGVTPAGLSGESRYNINHGDILIWNSTIGADGGWTTVPGDDIGGGIDPDDIAALDPVFGRIWSTNAMTKNCPLYWGNQATYTNDTDRDNPIGEELAPAVSEFKFLVSIDAQEIEVGGFPSGVYDGTWFVVGAKNEDGDSLPLITKTETNSSSTDDSTIDTIFDNDGNEIVYGVYFREGIDGIAKPDNDLNDLIVGHTPGCVETAGMSLMHWGTAVDHNRIVEGGEVDLNYAIYATEAPLVDGSIRYTGNVGPTADNGDSHGAPLIAEKIIAVAGYPGDPKDVPDDQGNLVTIDTIDWTVVFSRAGKPYELNINRPATSNVPPFAGPFLYSKSAPCVSGGTTLTRVSTREVTLIEIDELTTTFSEINRFYGRLPIDLDAYEVQENYNKLLAEITLDLHKLKPTMLVATFTPSDPDAEPDESVPNYDVNGVHDLYVPIEGDLWFDPADNTLRAVKNVSYRPDASSDRPSFSAEWVIISGDDQDVTTDQVKLINSIRLYELYSQLFQVDMTPEDWEAKFNLITQEDLNLLNVDLFKTLHELKPTIHVGSTIHDKSITIISNKTNLPVELPYIAQRGDIWVDPTDYTMYICDYGQDEKPKLEVPPSTDYPYQDREGNYLFWIEVGGASGSGNRVFVQTDPPLDQEVVQGDLWVEDTTYLIYVRSNDTWVALTGDTLTSNGGNKVHVGLHPKTTPDDSHLGDMWFDTYSAEMRIWLSYDNNHGWYPISPGGISADYVQYAQSTIRQQNEAIASLADRLNDLESYVANTSNYSANNEYLMEQTLNSYEGIIDEALPLQDDDSTNTGY